MSTTATLLSISADAFDAICLYLKRHHFVRLFLTGDAQVLHKIRESRHRLRSGSGTLSPSSVKTLLLLRPHHLRMDAFDSETMSRLAPSMACLTSLHLRNSWLSSYAHFTSLESLMLDNYDGEALPPLPTTLTRLGWKYIYTGTQQPINLSYLTRLTRLDTWNHGHEDRCGEFEYPPSLLVLKSRNVVHSLDKLPKTLVVLKMYDTRQPWNVVLLSDLLVQFPDLNTLCVGNTLMLDVPIPPTLVKLVARFTNKDGNLLEIFRTLPPTLEHFHFSYIEPTLPLTNDEIMSSLARVLPGLNRKALFKFIRCLFRHSDLPLCYENRRALVDLANKRGFGGSGLIDFLSMKVSLGELSLDITGEFARLLLTHHYGRNNTITHYTPSQSRFFQTLAALDALVGEVLWLPNEEDCRGRWHQMSFFVENRANPAGRITELNIPIDACNGCLKLLMGECQFPRLVDIHYAVDGADLADDDGDSAVNLLHEHKRRMPVLERIRFICNENINLSDASIAKLKSMKLVEKLAKPKPMVCSRTFIYRVSVAANEIELEPSDEET